MLSESLTTFTREFEHEELHVFRDPSTGLRGAVAIHSTTLGPAAGGLRLATYSDLDGAVLDALRLARAMTFKNAAAGLDLGGGKAVLVDDGRWQDRTARMRAFGHVLERLNGRFVTAEDVGTTPDDMETIASVTAHVAGRPSGQGDPSHATARTVFAAIADAAEIVLERDVASLRVGVLGVGHVGARLVTLLRAAGAVVEIADINGARARAVADAADVNGSSAGTVRDATRAHVVPVDDFVTRDLDVLAPCALGGAIRAEHVHDLRCRVIAGAANNPLASDDIEAQLTARGIFYVPDFLANSGGIIHIAADILDFQDGEVDRRIGDATQQTRNVLRESRATGRSAHAIAAEIVASRLHGTSAPRALEH